MTGAELIAKERQRQIDEEHYSLEHDALYNSDGRLGSAAACYAFPESIRQYIVEVYNRQSFPIFWPWPKNMWKPTPHDRIKELTKSGALIAAEIDRLLALQEQKAQERESDARTE